MSHFGFSASELEEKLKSVRAGGVVNIEKVRREIEGKPVFEPIMAIVATTMAIIIDNGDNRTIQSAALAAMEETIRVIIAIHDEELEELRKRCESLEKFVSMLMDKE